jgi:GntR family transcriptional regulator
MAGKHTSLGARIFGGRWALAARTVKPDWVQIEEQLAGRIESGALAPGERLPPERHLAVALGVSRMTVRQALAALAARGLVERGVGRGTFVRSTVQVEHDLNRVVGFTEQAQRQGRAAGARVLAVSELAAPAHVARALELAADAPVLRLERVRSSDGVPVVLEDSWLPAELFPDLLGRPLTGSLYELMRDGYELAPVGAVEKLEPVVARRHEAAVLEVAEGVPLMLVQRTAYAAGGVPVEYACDRHVGDRARFVVRVVPDDVLGAARDGR